LVKKAGKRRYLTDSSYRELPATHVWAVRVWFAVRHWDDRNALFSQLTVSQC